MTISRTADNGGDVTYNSYEELAKGFEEGLLHPNDLKPTVAKIINELI
jgi:tyrosyl-tRNA synthetase